MDTSKIESQNDELVLASQPDRRKDMRYLWMLGVVGITMLLLICHISTGWLVRMQTRSILKSDPQMIALLKDLGVKEAPGLDLSSNAVPPKTNSQIDDYAGRLKNAAKYPETLNPNDKAALLHAQVTRIVNIEGLAARYPERRAEIIGHALRYASTGLLRISRSNEAETYLRKPFNSKANDAKTSDPDHDAMEMLEGLARQGEVYDPDNAYFSIMDAVVLFAEKKDKEGLAALHRAASKPIFQDYSFAEADVDLEHREKLNGRQPVFVRTSIYAATLLPHYAQIRSMARLVTYLAAREEEQGNIKAGLAIRRDMMRCSALLRAKSTSTIGSLVGIAMFNTSTFRPGGTLSYGMSQTNWEKLSDNERAVRRIPFFASYLKQHGQESEANWVLREYEAGKTVTGIIDKATNAGVYSALTYLPLFNRWVIATISLYALVSLIALCISIYLLRCLRQEVGPLPTLVAVTICCMATILALMQGALCAMGTLLNVITNLSSSGSEVSPVNLLTVVSGLFAAGWWGKCLFAMLATGLPWLLTIWLAIASRFHRRESPTMFTTLLFKTTAIASLLMVVIYASAVTSTVAEEDRKAAEITRYIQNEGKYYADFVHAEWPPMTTETKE